MRNERKLQNILTKLSGKSSESESSQAISIMQLMTAIFLSLNILTFSLSVEASPNYTTYQAKIIKPDGYPLEATSVNFRFTVMDETASCILYTERYSAVNMQGTGGLISFSLGSGVKQYPVSATTFAEIFDNSQPGLSCDDGDPGSPDPVYVPQPSHTRKIVMQFQDANGWQTLPAMSVNAVPYAMYATEAQKLGGVSAGAYVKYSTIPTCGASEALRYNGATFSCIAGGSLSSVSSGDITTALGYTPANQASVGASFTLATSYYNSLEASHTSLSNSVGVSFALATGYYNALATSHTLLASQVNGLGSSYTALSSDLINLRLSVSGTQTDITSLQSTVGSLTASMSALTPSQWSTSGTTISYSSGNVGIGTSAPTAALEVYNSAAKKIILRDDQDGVSQSSIISFEGATDGAHGWVGFASTSDDDLSILAQGASGDVVIGSGNAFSKGLRIKGTTGNIGIGTTVPTAKIHIASGTSSIAPLKFTSGTLLASPASGAFEYDGFNLYFTDGSNQRRTIATTNSSGSLDNTNAITNSSGHIVMTPNSGLGSLIVSSTVNSTNSETGALVVNGGVGIAGSTSVAGNMNVSGSSIIDGTLRLSNLTSGSILFAGTGGTVTQDNSNLYWDNSNKRLGVGTTAPATSLDVNGAATFRQGYFEKVGALGILTCGSTNITGFATNLYTLTACASGTTTLNIPTITGWPSGNMSWIVTFFVTGQTSSVFNVSYNGATTAVFWDKNSTGGSGGASYTGFSVNSGTTNVITCSVLNTGSVAIYCGVAAQY